MTSDRMAGADQLSQSAVTCAAPNPIALVRDEHALQLELCEVLDAIASALPEEFDPALAVTALSILQGSVPAHTRFEDEALFPLLRRRLPPEDPVTATLLELASEHDRDKDLVDELTEAMKSAIATGRIENRDELAVQLAGFCDSRRRHIACEDFVVLPVANAVLTGADLAELQMWIMASDHPRCSHQAIVAIKSVRSGRHPCRSCPSSVPPFEDRWGDELKAGRQ